MSFNTVLKRGVNKRLGEDAAVVSRRNCQVGASARYGGLEVVELDGFDEMVGKSGLQTSFDVPVIAKAADALACNEASIKPNLPTMK